MVTKAAPKKVVVAPKPLTPIQMVKAFTPNITAPKPAAKGGTGVSKTSPTPTSVKGGGATIGKPTPSLPTKQSRKSNSLFTSIGNAFKDAINSIGKKNITGSVPNADIFNGIGKNESNYQINPEGNYLPNPTFTPPTPFGMLKNAITPKKTITNPTIINTPGTNSQNSGALTPGEFGGSINPTASETTLNPKDVFGGTDYLKDLSIADSSSTTTKENADGSSTVTKSSYAPTETPKKVSYTGIDGANKAIMEIKKDATSLSSDPWFSDKNSNSIYSKRLDTWTDGIAKGFDSTDAFTNAYNTDTAFKANVDSLSKYGITPSSLSAKIENNTNMNVNGIQKPQTTQEYLDSLLNVPKFNTGNKEMDKLMTEQALSEQNFTRQQIEMIKGDRDTIGMEEKNKIEADTRIELENEKMANSKASEREKAQYQIDKSKAEFDKADAEMEINRINSKNSMLGLLAKLGALDTSGAAGYALAQLDQKYQASRAELKSNYDMGVREINMNLNDSINKLQYDFDDNVIKINSDLSKSEREINLEIMKLQNGMNKDIIGFKMDAFKELERQKDKASAKAEKLSNDYTSMFFDTASTANYFESLPAGFKESWKANAPTWGAGGVGGKANLPDLMQDFTNFNKNKPVEQKNYTAANIPDDIMTSIQDDITNGVPDALTLIKLYPEVSSSYLTTLFNNSSQ